MGEYYKAVRYFPHIRLPEPKPQQNREGVLEAEALRLIYGLSGIVFAGVLYQFYQKQKTISGFDLNLRQYCSRLNSTKDYKKRVIDTRRSIIPQLVPEEDRQSLSTFNKEITLLGITALGILSLVYPDKIGEASIRFHALAYLFRKEPLAALVYSQYPHAFDGYQTIDELLKIKSFSDLETEELKRLYELCNL